MNKPRLWTDIAWEDYRWWQQHDRKTLQRINKLIASAQITPFEGIGKPEPLRESLVGFWSRRIDDTHRLIYAVIDEQLAIIACRYQRD